MSDMRLSEFARWEPVLGGFVRLTLDAAGRILARTDMEPTEKRAMLRHLFKTRASADQRNAVASFLIGSGLVEPPGHAKGVSNAEATLAMTQRMLSVSERPIVAACIARLGCEWRDFLVLVWAVVFVAAPPGHPLARLEDIDPDLPWCPPVGVPSIPTPINVDETLAEIADKSLPARHSWP